MTHAMHTAFNLPSLSRFYEEGLLLLTSSTCSILVPRLAILSAWRASCFERHAALACSERRRCSAMRSIALDDSGYSLITLSKSSCTGMHGCQWPGSPSSHWHLLLISDQGNNMGTTFLQNTA